MIDEKLLKLELQLFADGGGDGAGGSGEGATGATETVAESQVDESSTDNIEAEFEELIKGKYKDIYNSKVSNTVQSRLKNSKDAEAKLNALEPSLQMLRDRYGIEADDIDGLYNAINDDDDYLQQEALEKGLTVQSLKQMKQIQFENDRLMAEKAERERREQADRQYTEWMKQAEDLKRELPDFDIQSELQNNPDFANLLKNNVTVRGAFFATHHDDMMLTGMKAAYDKATADVTNSVRANGARPVLNGQSNQAAAVTKAVDVSSLTKAQMEDYIRRARNGERITFKE